ncbi:hypothetical protein [Pyrofollis japonicus]|uniref:hypothetical protein n=1 Tax=Pyrofollis japonicus TaxID=3060460 RepID=UPI00295BA877|nr:hypothetical protein [Pyrofollis japonicus]
MLDICWRPRRQAFIWLLVSIVFALLAGIFSYYATSAKTLVFAAIIFFAVFIISLVAALVYYNRYRVCKAKHLAKRAFKHRP